MTGNVYIVRQQAFVFVAFAAAGALFCVAPWLIGSLRSPLAWLTMLSIGVISVVVAAFGWKSCRIGHVVDRFGIWCGGYSVFKKKLIPWNTIFDAKSFTWNCPEAEHEDVLLSLTDNDAHPAGVDFARHEQNELRRIVGECAFEHPLLIGHDEWDWSRDEFVAIVQRCIRDPSVRLSLGEFNHQAALTEIAEPGDAAERE